MTEIMNQDLQLRDNQLNYETKYIPEFDIYEKNEYKNDIASFGSFITKGANGSIFALESIEEFFAKTPSFYNPLRKVANLMTSESTVAKIPNISAITTKFGAAGNNEGRSAKAETIINLLPNSAKLMVSEHFTKNTGSVDGYIKNLLGRALGKVEREAFVRGTKIGGKDEQVGLLSILNATNTVKAARDKVAENIKEAIFKLNVDYRSGACFMISSDIQKKLALTFDKDNKAILNDNKLFGYDVHTLDEATDTIIFGNFALGYVICDLNSPEIKKYELYENPGMLGFSLPCYAGAAVTEAEAFQFVDMSAA